MFIHRRPLASLSGPAAVEMVGDQSEDRLQVAAGPGVRTRPPRDPSAGGVFADSGLSGEFLGADFFQDGQHVVLPVVPDGSVGGDSRELVGVSVSEALGELVGLFADK